jgi:zinc transporter ZupT
MTLILSIVAMLLGPVIYSAGRDNPLAKRILDGFVVLTIAAIIGFDVIPEALQHGGSLAIVVILLGLAFPLILERLFRKATDTAHLFIVAIAALGLLIHSVIDGIALLPESGDFLAHAIVLHRLPVGMAIWWAVRPNFGKTAAVIVFTLIGLATTAGYFVGDAIIELAEARTLAMLQAFVSGSLIHVVAFGVKHKHD